VERMEDVVMEKKVVKSCLVKSITVINLHSCHVVIIIQLQLLMMAWFYHGVEEYLDN
jgi:hypothetical protein